MMMYEEVPLNCEMEKGAQKAIAPKIGDVIAAMVEINYQLSVLSEFLFGDKEDPFEAPKPKCLDDAVDRCDHMAQDALARIAQIKSRLGA